MAEYRYKLDKTSKKLACPACNKKRFVLYIDVETNQPLNSTVGRCDREQSCGYHFTPKQYFDKTGEKPDDWRKAPAPMPKPKPERQGRLPFRMVKATLNRFDENQLIRWLSTLPGWNFEMAEHTSRLYNIGTGNKDVSRWPIYWQVDHEGKVRSGKLIKYDEITGKRIKVGYSYDWIHSRLIKAGKLPDDKTRWSLDQCLFGLHLIRDDKSKPVAIVEGEKTALIASQYLPQFIWLSTGQLNGLNDKKLMPLRGRTVVLFPDKGAYSQWKDKADEFSYLMPMKVSDLLEVKAPDEHDGYDLADYLISFDITTFSGSTAYQKKQNPTFTPPPKAKPLQSDYPASWDSIEPPKNGTPEYFEMIREELKQSEVTRLDLVCELDPKVAKLIHEFDAVL